MMRVFPRVRGRRPAGIGRPRLGDEKDGAGAAMIAEADTVYRDW
jgi:hypothetical protein